MQQTTRPPKTSPFLQGGGEMGTLTRDFNWSQTSLGTPDAWPQSLRSYVSLLLNSRFPMFLFWGPEHLCFYNDAYRPSLGNSGKHPGILGTKAKEAWPEIWDFIGPMIEGILAGGEATWFEDQLVPIYRNGQLEDVYWTFSYSPVSDESGNPAGVFVTCTETTKAVVNIRQAQESEERFQNLVRGATAAIVVLTGEEMKVEIVNEAYGRLIELTPADLLGKPLFDVIPEAKDFYRPILEKVFRTGEPVHLYDSPYSVVVNGRRIEGFLNVVYQPYRDAAATLIGVMVICQDVTEQVAAKRKTEESEARFRALIEEAPVATCLYTGREMRIDVINDTMIAYMGKGRSVIGKPFAEALPETKDQPFLKILEGIYASGETFQATSAPAQLLVNGILETRYFDYTFKPLKNTAGEVYGIMNMGVDVTDQVLARHRIEDVVAERTAELAAANLLLGQNNRELEQFAYIASHDLQEPLRKVSTFAQMLRNHLGAVDERSQAYFDKITAASQRMMQLIRDVLDFSRLSNQQRTVEPIDLGRLIDFLISDFELVMEQKGAVVRHQDLPTLRAHPLQMRQLFGNLLSNALKFTKEGVPPVISISSQPLSDEEKGAHKDLLPEVEYCLITVADNGIGFGPEHAEKIFNIFQRLHGKSEYQGTGIGLALCKKIAQNHQGDIWATGQPGRGAAFHIILPCPADGPGKTNP